MPTPPPVLALPQSDLTIPFQGPESAHVSYSDAYSYLDKYVAIEFGVQDPSGTWHQVAYQEGVGVSLSGEYQDTGLTTGQHIYKTRTRVYNEYTEAWGAWSDNRTQAATIDGTSATGTLLFIDPGTASDSDVMKTLRTDLPDMLPIRTFWSPSTSITALGLMNRIAAGNGLARAIAKWTSTYVPDFVVVVLPKAVAG